MVRAGELLYVRLRYTDEEGTVKPLARGDIHLTVAGGKLLALGSACPYNAAGYLNDTTDTYYGEALAIIAPTGSGKVSIQASSPYGTASVSLPCLN